MTKLKDLFYHKGIPDYISKILEDSIVDVADWTATHYQQEVVNQGGKFSNEIERDLNEYERAHPRRDPALRGLRTDLWVMVLHNEGKQFKHRRGQWGFTVRYYAVNLQKPYRYKLQFLADDNTKMYDLKYGNIYMNEYPDNPTTPLGYMKHIKSPLVRNSTLTKKTKEMDKIGYKAKGTIGNLAAVRLAQKGGYVYPGSHKSNNGGRVSTGSKRMYKDIKNKSKEERWYSARKIVFWVQGRVRNPMGKGRPINIGNRGGYVFVSKRRYKAGGHERYLEDITNIIETDINRYMGEI